MFKPVLIATAAVAALGAALAPAAQAQGMPDFTRMDLSRMNNNFNNQMNAQMAQRQQQIVQSNLNNPQVMAAYRAGVCGPGLTPQQFAYKYAATGGCTPQGYANYNRTTQQITANDAAAYRNYQAAQAQRSQAMAAQQQGFYNNQNQAGMQLRGCQYGQNSMGQVVWFCP